MDPAVSATSALPIATDELGLRRDGQGARGEVLAFEQLVASRTDRTFRIARAILGNDADASDATQDAFVSVWRELPRLRDVDSFDAWLGRILVNSCRTQLRVRKRVREISLDITADRSNPGPTISDQVGDSDLLAHAFERLDPDKRTILVLHYVDHRPVATIADALSVTVGTAKWRLSEARAALQRALVAEGEARS
jgi:RNA polymerase sigma-70 factor (ECF subfamily)